MLPVIPTSLNKFITDAQGQLSTFPFPPNVAGDLSKEMRQAIVRWMLKNYVWPQIEARRPYEEIWNKMLSMARATWKISDCKLDEKGRAARAHQKKVLEGNASPGDKADVADTVIFDAVDRLTNLNHFISWKGDMPVQYQVPKFVRRPMESTWYSPSADLVDSANSWLQFCSNGTQFYRKHWMQARHHYTYGVSYAVSEYEQEITQVKRRDPQNPKQFIDRPELTKIGVSFEGISIRKLWLNTKLSPYHMEWQPCPFWYEEIPRFAIVANPYDAEQRPFGYANLDSLPQGQWLFGTTELSSLEDALKQLNPNTSLQSLANPVLDIELKWNFYPMLPLVQVPLTQEILDGIRDEAEAMKAVQRQYIWDFDEDGSKQYPLSRYVMEMFGVGLTSGQVEIIRLQENYYPHNSLPIYGSAHMPDYDSGQYSPAIGQILESHYTQLCVALNQFLDNKDLLNDPPVKIQVNSPSMNRDLHKKGAKNPVNSMNDYEDAALTDNTGTTTAFVQAVREQAQTSSKAVDAILGKAMGSRTTATEASNIFEAAMSGVTTDINLFNHDISGGYATRVWEYAGLWVDPDVLAAITGQYGFAIKPEHFLIRLDIDWAIGSTYIESMTRQTNYRYMLETGRGDPAVNTAYLWKQLLEEWGIPNADRIINDQGQMQQIQEANDQAASTYLGDLVMVDPDQQHDLAIQVKLAYLKDRKSVWNTNPKYAANAPMLVEQIKQHQMYLQLELLRQMAQAEAQGQPGMLGGGSSLQPLQNAPAPPPQIGMAGQASQQSGTTL
jgi:hypothetical protein